VAKNSRPVKWFVALAVILLYFLPFYQKYFSDRQADWNDLEVTALTGEKTQGSAPSYFKENFVNQARPGMKCHVSSLAAVGEARLICTWYAGSREGASDVAIYKAFYDENTGAWTKPEVLLDRQQCLAELRRWVGKLGNAVVINDHEGGLWLFYATLLGGWSTASLNYKGSRDGGQTWSDSRKLILSPFFNLAANVKNNGLPLSPGAYLLPVYQEFLRKFGQVVLWRPHDEGLSYQIRRMVGTGRTLQPVLIPQNKRRLLAFFRNAAGNGENYILRAESQDAGQTWSALTRTTLPNPNSGFAMIRLPSGGILGAINHAFQDRSDLTLVVSRDGGQNWQILKVLENSPGKEYSYPFLLRSRGKYHLTYTYERDRIKHVVFNDAWLRQNSQ